MSFSITTGYSLDEMKGKEARMNIPLWVVRASVVSISFLLSSIVSSCQFLFLRHL